MIDQIGGWSKRSVGEGYGEGYGFDRTMTLWSSKEEVEANLDKIRAAAGSAVGMSVTGAMQGNVVLELE